MSKLDEIFGEIHADYVQMFNDQTVKSLDEYKQQIKQLVMEIASECSENRGVGALVVNYEKFKKRIEEL